MKCKIGKKMPINTCKIKISILNAHDEEQKNIEHNQGTCYETWSRSY